MLPIDSSHLQGFLSDRSTSPLFSGCHAWAPEMECSWLQPLRWLLASHSFRSVAGGHLSRVLSKSPTKDELRIQADNLELTFQSLPLLRHFAFNLETFLILESNSPLDRSPRRRYIDKPRGYYHYVPPIFRAALLHPTLETFDVPTLRPDWITHPTLPLPPRPSDRPLLIPSLDRRSNPGFVSTDRPDRFGSNASLAPVLQALVALGIHVHDSSVYFDDLSSDLVDLARNPIQGLQTLKILLTDGPDNPNTHLIHFPSDTLLLLAASHPQLTTIKTRGIIFSDDRRRTTKELLWSLLSRIPGFECVVHSREEAWTTLDQMSFALRFTTPGKEGRRQLVELELDVHQEGWPYPISLEETLVGIGSHFVDLEVLKLSGKFLSDQSSVDFNSPPRFPSSFPLS